MKKLLYLFTLVTLIIGCRQKAEEELSPVYQQLNDSIYTIRYGAHKVEIDANVSGRITSYQLKGNELLTPRSVHEEYFGSTLWLAPQSDHWPPPAQLDGDPYKAFLAEDGILMESTKDVSTGLQFTKFFDFNPADTSFEITYTIKNLNDSARHAAPWEVTRVKGGLSFFPLGEEPFLEKSKLKSVSTQNDIVWYDYRPDSLDTSQKLFSSGSEGWIAHVVDGLLFVKKVQDIHPLKTAPEQGEVEIYAAHQFPYIELENHGKYVLLEPDEFIEWPVKWYVRVLPQHLVAKVGNDKLVDHVRLLVNGAMKKKPL